MKAAQGLTAEPRGMRMRDSGRGKGGLQASATLGVPRMASTCAL